MMPATCRCRPAAQAVLHPSRPLSLQAYTALLAQNGGSFKDREALQAFIDDVKVRWVLACVHAWAALPFLTCRKHIPVSSMRV